MMEMEFSSASIILLRATLRRELDGYQLIRRENLLGYWRLAGDANCVPEVRLLNLRGYVGFRWVPASAGLRPSGSHAQTRSHGG